jgi:starch phosphorylase
VRRQEDVDAVYHDEAAWVRSAVLNVAGMGNFSSDRTILEYAHTVWNAKRMSTR